MVTLFYAVDCNPKYATQLSYFSILVGVCIIESLVWLTKRLPVKVLNVLEYIGANTLPIYLFHPMFTLSSKLLLNGLITSGNVLYFCVLTVITATIFSLLIGHALDSVGLSMLLFRKPLMR